MAARNGWEGERLGAVKIAIVGAAGNMGGAILAGLVDARTTAELVAAVLPEDAAAVRERHPGVTVGTVAEVPVDADVVVLAVKPYDIAALVGSLPVRAGQLIVSIAAGITTAQIEAVVPAGVAVVRVMPNTPASIGQGISIVSGGATSAPGQVELACELMGSVGATVVVPEKQLDAATALSGSGPAYVFYIAESLIEAGVHLGLPRPVAARLVEQTLVGSSLLLQGSDEHPAVLREQVTSPGGTTAAALAVFEADGLRSTLLKATRANRDRSREIAAEG